jgi:sulfopropanediol 3-dehydrogenase
VTDRHPASSGFDAVSPRADRPTSTIGHVLQSIKSPAPGAPTADGINRSVAEILERIDREGVEAIRHYSRRFDAWDPEQFRISESAIAAAERSVPEPLRGHIDFALEQVRRFAVAQRETLHDLQIETMPGVTLGHRLMPVGHVGAYVPGGRYPLIAAALMTVAVPRVAGVGKVTAVAPPASDGGVDPASLYAMAASGADEIFCIGGVQAIAAMALGLAGPSAVDMIVGPGNAYVTEAKRQLYGRVGIDLVAGPTEILIVADASASPATLALDLLAQAEHGPTSRAVLLTWDRALAEATLTAIDYALSDLPNGAAAAESWRSHGEIALVASAEEALVHANQLAFEHVHIQGSPEQLDFFNAGLRNYGSLFLGETTTVVFGDKAIGTNHCLPTGRGARYTGGLWVGTFLKVLTYQELTASGAQSIAPSAAAIAAAEGLAAHAQSAALRANGPMAAEEGEQVLTPASNHSRKRR